MESRAEQIEEGREVCPSQTVGGVAVICSFKTTPHNLL